MAGLDRFRVVVVTGHGAEADGVVVRLPGVLVVARPGRAETTETTKRLLALCAEVAGEAGAATTTGRRLMRRVAGLLTDTEAEQVPDFCLLATVAERVAALVHGSMDLLAGGATPLALSGAESTTWVDRLLPAEVNRVDVGPTGGVGRGGMVGSSMGVEPSFPLDLRVGAVPGVGATLLLSDAPAMVTPKGSAESLLAGLDDRREPSTGGEIIPSSVPRIHDPLSTAPPPLTPLLSDKEAARRQRAGAEPTQAADFEELEEDAPTELASRQERPEAGRGEYGGAAAGHGGVGAKAGGLTADPQEFTQDEHEAVTELPGRGPSVDDLFEDDAPTVLPSRDEAQVEGVLCANGHFNHPQAPYCAECGLSLAQTTNRTVWGPRPTIGVLVFDDGLTVNVDIDLVIGRQPDRDEAVRAGRARPIAVEDGESAVSRVHAVINLNGWDAVITDRGSANGTYIAPPDATVWTPLAPHQPAPLVAGTRVQVGKRTFVFNSHLQI
jgi:hypothetical protein